MYLYIVPIRDVHEIRISELSVSPNPNLNQILIRISRIIRINGFAFNVTSEFRLTNIFNVLL